MLARWELEGVPELRAQLGRLTPAAQRKVVRPAFLAGARFLRKAVRLAAPIGPTRNLSRGVTIEAPRFFDAANPSVEVGWKRGRAGGSHAHLVEKGTKERRTRTGANRGAARANPFFEQAIEAASLAAFGVIRAVWATRLALAAAAAKRGAL